MKKAAIADEARGLLRLVFPGRQARDSAGRTLSVCAEARSDSTQKTGALVLGASELHLAVSAG